MSMLDTEEAVILFGVFSFLVIIASIVWFASRRSRVNDTGGGDSSSFWDFFSGSGDGDGGGGGDGGD